MNWLTLWLSIDVPDTSGLVWKIGLGIFVALFLGGVALRIGSSRLPRYLLPLFRRIVKLCVTMGFLGMLLWFLSFENVRFLGGRFWYPIWLIATLVWGGFLVRFAKKELPAMEANRRAWENRDKYLPKSSK